MFETSRGISYQMDMQTFLLMLHSHWSNAVMFIKYGNNFREIFHQSFSFGGGDIRIEKQISNCHPPCVFTVYPPGNLRSSPSHGAPGVIE